MEAFVEVTATERTRALLQRAGRLKHVHFVSKPSANQTVHGIVVALLSDFEERPEQLQGFVAQGTSFATPLVLMRLAKSALSVSALQLLALLTSRFGAEGSDPYVSASVDTVRRILKAHALGAEKELVASAEIENGMLSVWSCEPKVYHCATSEIPALAALGSRALGRMEISGSGSRIHWPDGDIDLDMDAIREFADPAVRQATECKYRAEAARYGAAIRRIRETEGLRQGSIPGLSEREVRRLENGEVQPHLDTLKKLAKAHRSSLSDYMTKLATGSKRYAVRRSRKRGKAPRS
jgi:hypothetical protein